MLKRSNGAQFSPCIIAWAKRALTGKVMPQNQHKCSKQYWDEAVYEVGKRIGRNSNQIRIAQSKWPNIHC